MNEFICELVKDSNKLQTRSCQSFRQTAVFHFPWTVFLFQMER